MNCDLEGCPELFVLDAYTFFLLICGDIFHNLRIYYLFIVSPGNHKNFAWQIFIPTKATTFYKIIAISCAVQTI